MPVIGRRAFLLIGGSAGAAAAGGAVLRCAAPSAYTKAKTLPSVLADSLRFWGRERPARFDSAIVDCDGTLYRADSTIEALMRTYGKDKGREMHHRIISDVKKGSLSIDKALIRGFEVLANAPGGFNIHLWDEIMADFRKGRLFRDGLISALCQMQEKQGMRVIIATRASERSARWIAQNTGLHAEKTFSLGTSCRSDSSGMVTALTELIGTEDGQVGAVKSTTKMTKTGEILRSKAVPFAPDATVMITDDVLDKGEMLAAGWGLLLVPANPTERSSFQRASLSFGLYDEACMDDRNEARLRRHLLKALS